MDDAAPRVDHHATPRVDLHATPRVDHHAAAGLSDPVTARIVGWDARVTAMVAFERALAIALARAGLVEEDAAAAAVAACDAATIDPTMAIVQATTRLQVRHAPVRVCTATGVKLAAMNSWIIATSARASCRAMRAGQRGRWYSPEVVNNPIRAAPNTATLSRGRPGEAARHSSTATTTAAGAARLCTTPRRRGLVVRAGSWPVSWVRCT